MKLENSVKDKNQQKLPIKICIHHPKIPYFMCLSFSNRNNESLTKVDTIWRTIDTWSDLGQNFLKRRYKNPYLVDGSFYSINKSNPKNA